MIRLVELKTDEDFNELSLTLEKLRHSDMVVTLKQSLASSDGTYAFTDIQKDVIEDANPLIQINGKWVYMTVQGIFRDNARKVQSMFSTFVQRGTLKAKNGGNNDYVMMVDVVRADINDGSGAGLVYCISAIAPVIGSTDSKGNYTLVFEVSDVCIDKEVTTIEEIEFLAGEIADDQEYDTLENNEKSEEKYTGTHFVDTQKYIGI